MGKTGAKIKRKIVQIDEDKCDGCGLCIMSCAEGALQIIDGKARLVSDKYCDSLGACLSECPQDAISIIEREGEAFDEEAVKKHLAEQPPPVPGQSCGCPSAVLKHFEVKDALPCGCPSSTVSQFKATAKETTGSQHESHASELAHWPVQLTLVPAKAPFLQGADLLLAADCTAFAYGGFHAGFLKDHALLVACPKLDNYEAHLAKLSEILRQSDVKSLTVLRMEVPCCAGLTRMAMQAILSSDKDIPFKESIIGTRGEIKS
ncbi:MAG: 4Fe-4S binding protein [Chloroflexi bacterium]|nr:4Fe-4S binding protein [Chloroflexota bacterium]